MKIAVLAGGYSTERAVSAISGIMVANALTERSHKVALCDPYFGFSKDLAHAFCYEVRPVPTLSRATPDLASLRKLGGGHTDVIAESVFPLLQAADVTFLALHGGDGENGVLQAILDAHGICYTGSGAAASALAMDKIQSKQCFQKAGIPTAPWMAFSKDSSVKDAAEQILSTLGIPCVIKPCHGGSSIGVTIVQDEPALLPALDLAFAGGDTVLAEQYLTGREISVGILGQTPLPGVEILPLTGFYDYQNKYQSGCTQEICPAPLCDAARNNVEHTACTAFRALGLRDYGRVDLILSADNTAFVLEANTLPGMTSGSLLPQGAAAVGISFGELCERIVQLALARKKASRGTLVDSTPVPSPAPPKEAYPEVRPHDRRI